jgi:hypothetical protein
MNADHDDRRHPAGRSSSEQRAERFEDALRRWAARPPVTPAADAARRLEARLAARADRADRPRAVKARLARLAVAAAAVLAVGLAIVLGTDSPDAPDTPAADVPRGAPAPTGDEVLVIDLDDETTLYMNLARSLRSTDRFGPEPAGAAAPGQGDRS